MRLLFLLMVLLVVPMTAFAGGVVQAEIRPVQVVMETSLGDIVLEVYQDKAPQSAAYFLGLVDRSEYEGASFYRSGFPLAPGPKARLLQGGILRDVHAGTLPVDLTGVKMLAEFETTEMTGLKHQYGTVSMGRDLFDTGDVIPEFFVCLGDSPQFDVNGRTKPDAKGFPAFAKVVEGMDVVEAIAGRDTGGATGIKLLEGQLLSEPVSIAKIYRR
ncbi:MAG: peptidylprolyl isomerase [Desulfuromonadales bacterium]|nr:peptidylprolyl isomerase [Desulfuromonadales bacterium]MDH4006448.1 peptidylprolyl isomerase [Desulfuromonadales bacterium]